MINKELWIRLALEWSNTWTEENENGIDATVDQLIDESQSKNHQKLKSIKELLDDDDDDF